MKLTHCSVMGYWSRPAIGIKRADGKQASKSRLAASSCPAWIGWWVHNMCGQVAYFSTKGVTLAQLMDAGMETVPCLRSLIAEFSSNVGRYDGGWIEGFFLQCT